MLIKSKLVLFCSIFTLAVTTTMFPSTDLMADGASACPAFTTAMVDAAAMAYGLYPGDRVVAEDDPTFPVIYCHIDEETGLPFNSFSVDVNSSELYAAFVIGKRLVETEPHVDTQLSSFAEQLSLGQMRACRAAILRSFVWKNYCAPKNSGFIVD